MRDPQDLQYWRSRGTHLWNMMADELSKHHQPLTYVIRTDFIRWLSEDQNRIMDYIERDTFDHLVTNYIRELIETDEQ